VFVLLFLLLLPPAVSFSRGRPFRPFEQLLAVLPSASCSLLPPAFQWLMTNSDSPILDFYPEKFDIDMEGKRAEWEGVVKVPFISEERLLAAAASVPPERCVQ
jgi:5'-3' exonuclease